MNKSDLINALFSSLGAFLCIGLLAYLNSFFSDALWLIPPFGASMVLVMAAHTSPFAQPKNIFFGHIVSALSGLLVLYIIGDNYISLGLGVALAIFLMMLTDTIHPPAGANPIIVILTEQGLDFVVMPITIGVIIIIAFAAIFNKLLKRDYFL